MTNTGNAQTLTADAQAILDDMRERGGGGEWTAAANIRPNNFGGFDMHQPMGGTIRVERDDTDWIVRLFDTRMWLLGSQRLSGTFADLDYVAFVVANLAL